MSNKLADDLVLSSTTGSVTFRDPTTGTDTLKIIFHATDPEGVVDAPAGSIISGASGLYVANGGTSWTQFSPPTTFAAVSDTSSYVYGSDTTQQTFDASVSIPANFIESGAVVDIEATVEVRFNGAADQYTCGFVVGGISVWSEPTVTGPAGVTTGVIRLRARVAFSSAGNPATWLGLTGMHADYLRAVPLVAGARVPQVIDGVAFLGANTTVAIPVSVQWAWIAGADVNSRAQLTYVTISVVNP
jgi:hypothetical protein